MDEIAEPVASKIVWELARKEAAEQLHDRTKQLLMEGNKAKDKGDLKKAQALLIEAWSLISKDIETRGS